NSTAVQYHITPADLSNLTAEVRKFNAKSGSLFLQQQAYLALQRKAKMQPDVKVLMKYQTQRGVLIRETHARIRSSLTRPNWAALKGYINGEFANAYHQGNGAGK